MYKCKECGAEYEEKPDYCDCGNDEFEEIVIELKTQNKQKEIESQTVEKMKPQPAESMKFNKPIQNSYIPKRELNIDPISLIIFGVCILLSLYVIFFAWNGTNGVEESAEKGTKTQNTVENKNIPSVDKIWDNTLPVVKKEEPKQEEPKKEEKVEQIIKQILPVQTQKKSVTQKTAQTKKVTTVPLQKTTKTTKTAQTIKQQTNTAAQEQAKKAAEEKAKQETAAKQKAEAERKAAEAAQLKKLQEEQAKKAAEEKARKAQASKQEYTVYKANLRNTIARKIDFTKVIGDGSCTVSFRIDSNGNLVNRSFSKQSSNNTLNDAVYSAVMSTPSFNPPPEAYNNEVLNLNIKFYNGNFEISLP